MNEILKSLGSIHDEINDLCDRLDKAEVERHACAVAGLRLDLELSSAEEAAVSAIHRSIFGKHEYGGLVGEGVIEEFGLNPTSLTLLLLDNPEKFGRMMRKLALAYVISVFEE